MKKTPTEELKELLEQKTTKRTSQNKDDKSGYDAGWIDSLKYAIKILDSVKITDALRNEK